MGFKPTQGDHIDLTDQHRSHLAEVFSEHGALHIVKQREAAPSDFLLDSASFNVMIGLLCFSHPEHSLIESKKDL